MIKLLNNRENTFTADNILNKFPVGTLFKVVDTPDTNTNYKEHIITIINYDYKKDAILDLTNMGVWSNHLAWHRYFVRLLDKNEKVQLSND